MADCTGTVIESQLDYLTAACHSAKGMAHLELLASSWAHLTEARENRTIPFRLGPYEGWHCGRVAFGRRDAAGLIQLSGDLARQHFDTLYPDLDRISRLDIAVTTRLTPPQSELGRITYSDALSFYQAHPKSARPSCILNGDGGHTTYVGDRSSDLFLRVYNKEAESVDEPETRAHYLGCWRYELETKGQFAKVLACDLATKPVDERPPHIQSMVHSYVTKHGMTPAFPSSGGARLVPGFRRRSDRSSRLKWLTSTVKPTVDWLRSTGDLREVLDALGLAGYELRPKDEPSGDEPKDSE